MTPSHSARSATAIAAAMAMSRAAPQFATCPQARVPGADSGYRDGALLADKAFDGNKIIADLDQRGAKVVISQRPRRTSPLQIDEEMYKWRRLIENLFGKLKEFKRIAMRADKTDQSFKAIIYLAAAINSR